LAERGKASHGIEKMRNPDDQEDEIQQEEEYDDPFGNGDSYDFPECMEEEWVE